MPDPNIFQSMALQFADAPFAVLLADLDLKILYTNKYAEDMSRTLEFSDGIRLMAPPEDLDTCRQKLRQGESSRLFSSPMHAAALCLSVSPLREGEQIVGAFVTLAPAEMQPETIVDVVDGVSSSVLSSCFRYPLSQIFASLSVILRKLHADDNHTLDSSIKVINQSAYVMLRNINNIIARIRLYSSYRTEPKVVNLWEQIAELLEAADITLRPNGYTLSYSLPQGTDCVRCHFDQIAVALLNIISNACKASPKGGTVTVGGKRHGNLAIITVMDNGCGISQDLMDRVFAPFFSWNADTHAPPAMGLGLNVAKQIIYEEGGTLALNSREGEGTAVAFTLPIVTDTPDERLPLECGSSAYLLDHFSPVYWVLSDIIVPPNQ